MSLIISYEPGITAVIKIHVKNILSFLTLVNFILKYLILFVTSVDCSYKNKTNYQNIYLY